MLRNWQKLSMSDLSPTNWELFGTKNWISVDFFKKSNKDGAKFEFSWWTFQLIFAFHTFWDTRRKMGILPNFPWPAKIEVSLAIGHVRPQSVCFSFLEHKQSEIRIFDNELQTHYLTERSHAYNPWNFLQIQSRISMPSRMWIEWGHCGSKVKSRCPNFCIMNYKFSICCANFSKNWPGQREEIFWWLIIRQLEIQHVHSWTKQIYFKWTIKFPTISRWKNQITMSWSLWFKTEQIFAWKYKFENLWIVSRNTTCSGCYVRKATKIFLWEDLIWKPTTWRNILHNVCWKHGTASENTLNGCSPDHELTLEK